MITHNRKRSGNVQKGLPGFKDETYEVRGDNYLFEDTGGMSEDIPATYEPAWFKNFRLNDLKHMQIRLAVLETKIKYNNRLQITILVIAAGALVKILLD